MKILVVAYKFGSEEEIGRHLGTYHYFIEMTRRLKRNGHDVVVVAPWLTFWKRGSGAVDGVKIFRYYPPLWNSAKWFFLSRPLRRWYLVATKRAVLRLDGREKWDAILVWQARETGYAVSQISSRLRAPFIFRQITAWRWHVGRGPEEVFGRRQWYRVVAAFGLARVFEPALQWGLDRKNQKKFANRIYKAAAKILFVSRAAAEAEALEENFRSKITVWPVAIEADLFAPRGDREYWRKSLNVRGEKTLLFIGRINFAEKGIGYLLEAMPEIIKAVDGVNLVVIGGGGESERMNTLVKKLNIEGNVQLVGRQPFEKLADYLQTADALVVPSTWVEHFGQVTIEAMAVGVPVITTNIGGSPEINLHNQTGLVVPAADSVALARAAIQLLSDETGRFQMGTAARKRVLENYTYEVLTKQLEEIIKGPRNE